MAKRAKSDTESVEIVESNESEAVSPEDNETSVDINQKPKDKGIPKNGDIANNKKRDSLRVEIKNVTKVQPAKLTGDELQLAYAISNYISCMSPGSRVNVNKGIEMQKKLRTTLLSILNLNEDRFPVVMNWLIAVIKESRNNKGAFGDKYVMRFMSMLKLSPKQLRLYQRLINLLIVTAEIPNKRLISSKVDISYITNSITNDNIKNKVLKYYN